MGVLLGCSRDALPGEAAAFVICTYELGVSAVSQAGEKIFGQEGELVGKHLLDLRHEPARRRPARPARGPRRPARLRPGRHAAAAASPNAAEVGMLAARIATCGPPRAALVTVEPSEFGRR